MTKLNYLLACGIAASALALSAAPPTARQQSDSIESTKSVSTADSLTSALKDTIQAASGAVYTILDGEEYILKDGKAYRISEGESMEEIIDSETYKDEDSDIGTTRMSNAVADHVVPIVGIVFGLPCAAVVCIVWFLTYYFIRRNRDKNALISKAIDNNYTLPDAFFSQPASSETAIGEDNQPSAANSTKMFAAQPMGQRDPRRFSTGIMLVCIGVPVFIFFLVNGVTPAAFLCGGILIFIGLAKLLSYYFVPGYSNERFRRPNVGPRPPYQPQPPYGQGQTYQHPYQPPYGYQQSQGFTQGTTAGQATANANPGMNERQQCPPPVPPRNAETDC